MAVQRSTDNIPGVAETPLGPSCSLCENVMDNDKDCIVTNCKHTFHRACMAQWLRDSQECPNCRKLCHERDLVPVVSGTMTHLKGSNIRGRGRGSSTKRYNTRSTRMQDDVEGLAQPSKGDLATMGDSLDFNNSQIGQDHSPNLSQNVHNSTKHLLDNLNRSRRNSRNFNRMSQMIESTVQRALLSMNISSSQQQPNVQVPLPPLQTAAEQQNGSFVNPFTLDQNVISNPENIIRSSTSAVNINPDRITSMIQSWNVKFDGSSKGLRCEEFLYRINVLTVENFNGNFNDTVSKNLHVLLTGKAKDWFWRYHKMVNRIRWDSFCLALKKQYQDFRTTFDIREELHNRKQKSTESFEVFYDAIIEILDRLTTPLEDEELIEIIIRNLRPEIRHELLYVKVRSIGHLKELCQKRELLFNEETFRRSHSGRNPGNVHVRRIAAMESEPAIEEAEHVHSILNDEESKMEINAISNSDKIIKCWNCEEEGHYWDMCLKERKIFCYGCGLRNVYKPQCVKCTSNKAKNSKNF